MRGWLTPLGTEAPRTYWIRRGVVIGVALLLVAALAWGGMALGRPRPAAMTAAPAASVSATVGPQESATTAAATTPSGTPAATPATAATAPASSTAPAGGPVACDPASLALTVSGAPRVKSGSDEVLTLSVINRGKAACLLDLNAKTWELRITSGSDLIWSTAHCGEWVAAAQKTLQPEEAHEWSLTWNTRRSKPECQLLGDYLKPGTYVARATFGPKASDNLVIQLQG